MSVLIEGMEMPSNCMECPFKGFDRAKGRGNVCTIDDSVTLHATLNNLDVQFIRVGDCPLIEVPPHGRLIDADALLNDKGVGTQIAGWGKMYHETAIEYAPTVIPAESEGE